ncbi:MAG: PilZ domain-containing protein [Desulfovibrionaceae bacterium]|nr:PilZ domain-containing protein [Desulfovibrionaceae bacterium]MDD4952139.1 PilZ domain-containing protein [Desulfovibrionaceae bacterium]
MDGEQRTFSRIAARLKGYARPIASDDEPFVFQASVPQDTPDREKDIRSANIPEALADFLLDIDRKLDMLLSVQSQGNLRSDFPLSLQVMEISGAGIKFDTKAKVSEGDWLEMVLVLNQFPLRLSGAKGRVAGKDKHSGLWRFEFTVIRESDLEAVIQFVFQEQRQQIRHLKRNL